MGQGAVLKKDTMPLPLHHQAVETMNPKEREFPRVSCWETGKAGALTTVRELVSQSPRKGFHIVLTTGRTAQEPGAETIVSHCEQGHTLTWAPWPCMPLAFYDNLSLCQNPEDGLGITRFPCSSSHGAEL